MILKFLSAKWNEINIFAKIHFQDGLKGNLGSILFCMFALHYTIYKEYILCKN